eukprot:m.1600844 g.1600844  ORF g.1600844 m.1600844 type:complete len:2511 (+) comp25352_c1_seq1:388-7920(+)
MSRRMLYDLGASTSIEEEDTVIEDINGRHIVPSSRLEGKNVPSLNISESHLETEEDGQTMGGNPSKGSYPSNRTGQLNDEEDTMWTTRKHTLHEHATDLREANDASRSNPGVEKANIVHRQSRLSGPPGPSQRSDDDDDDCYEANESPQPSGLSTSEPRPILVARAEDLAKHGMTSGVSGSRLTRAKVMLEKKSSTLASLRESPKVAINDQDLGSPDAAGHESMRLRTMRRGLHKSDTISSQASRNSASSGYSTDSQMELVAPWITTLFQELTTAKVPPKANAIAAAAAPATLTYADFCEWAGVPAEDESIIITRRQTRANLLPRAGGDASAPQRVSSKPVGADEERATPVTKSATMGKNLLVRGGSSLSSSKRKRLAHTLSVPKHEGPTLDIYDFHQLCLEATTSQELELRILPGGDVIAFTRVVEQDQVEFVNEALWYKERQNNGQALLQALFDETKNSIWEKTTPEDVVLDAHVAHYFIRSSHNTYLTGDQKEGPFESKQRKNEAAKAEQYAKVLQSNCRCVEIDLWGDCDVRHGNLSGKVKLSLVLEKIAANAFLSSSLPVFISVEQHCGMRGQENFAREVLATLGDYLVSAHGEVDSGAGTTGTARSGRRRCITPQHLEGKILIKHKHRSKKGRRFHENIVALTVHSKSVSTKVADLLKHKDSNDMVIASVTEKKYVRAIKNSRSRDKLYLFNQEHITRIYPSATRLDSSNYDPQDCWNMGVQMAAINMQTPGVATFLDHGVFQQNGATGYVPKPAFMLKRTVVRDKLRRFDAMKPNTFCARLMDIDVLTIEILAGRVLRQQGSVDSDSVACKAPVVELMVCGVPADQLPTRTMPFVTKRSITPAFRAFWPNEVFTQEITCPELASVGFLVRSESTKAISRDDKVDKIAGQCFIPALKMRAGYRTVPLLDAHNKKIPGSSLLVRIGWQKQSDLYPTYRHEFVSGQGVACVLRSGKHTVMVRLHVHIELRKFSSKRKNTLSDETISVQCAPLNANRNLLALEDRFGPIIGNQGIPLQDIQSITADGPSDATEYDMTSVGRLYGHSIRLRTRGAKYRDSKTKGDDNTGLMFSCRVATYALLSLLSEYSTDGAADALFPPGPLRRFMDPQLWRRNDMFVREPRALRHADASVTETFLRARDVIVRHYTDNFDAIQLSSFASSTNGPVAIPTPLDGVTLQRKADGALGSLDESRTAILEFHHEARCAMVTGVAGCGKSVLGRAIAYHWARGTILHTFNLVFHISLTDLPEKLPYPEYSASSADLADLLHFLFFYNEPGVSVGAVRLWLNASSPSVRMSAGRSASVGSDVAPVSNESILIVFDCAERHHWGRFPFLDELLLADTAASEHPMRTVLMREDEHLGLNDVFTQWSDNHLLIVTPDESDAVNDDDFGLKFSRRVCMVTGPPGSKSSGVDAHALYERWTQQSLFQTFKYVFVVTLNDLPAEMDVSVQKDTSGFGLDLADLLYHTHFSDVYDRISIKQLRQIVKSEYRHMLIIFDAVHEYRWGSYPFVDRLLGAEDVPVTKDRVLPGKSALPARLLLVRESPYLWQKRILLRGATNRYVVPENRDSVLSINKIMRSAGIHLDGNRGAQTEHLLWTACADSALQRFSATPAALALLTSLICDRPHMFRTMAEERRRASMACTRGSSAADVLMEGDGADVRTMGTAELTQFLVHTLVQRNAAGTATDSLTAAAQDMSRPHRASTGGARSPLMTVAPVKSRGRWRWRTGHAQARAALGSVPQPAGGAGGRLGSVKHRSLSRQSSGGGLRSSSFLRTSNFSDDEFGGPTRPSPRTSAAVSTYDMPVQSRSATSSSGVATTSIAAQHSAGGKCIFPVDADCGITEQQWEAIETDLLPLEQMAYNSFMDNDDHLRIGMGDDKCLRMAVDMGVLLVHDGAHVESSRKVLVRHYVFATEVLRTYFAASFLAKNPTNLQSLLRMELSPRRTKVSRVSVTNVLEAVTKLHSKKTQSHGHADADVEMDADVNRPSFGGQSWGIQHNMDVLLESRFHELLRITVGLLGLYAKGRREKNDARMCAQMQRAQVDVISTIVSNCQKKYGAYKGQGEYEIVDGVHPSLFALCLGCIYEIDRADENKEALRLALDASQPIFLEKLPLNGGATGDKINLRSLRDISVCMQLISQIRVQHDSSVGSALLADPAIGFLTDLDLGNNGFGKDGVKLLADGFQSNRTVSKLNVSDNEIGKDGAEHLVRLLKHSSVLQLRCHRNAIGDWGAKSIASVLKHHDCTLESLGLMQNNIGDIGARDLFEGVAVCDTLRQLGLAKNRIGDTGADGAAIMLLRNKVLTHLHLGRNQLSLNGCNKILKSLQTVLEQYKSSASERDEHQESVRDDSMFPIVYLVGNRLEELYPERADVDVDDDYDMWLQREEHEKTEILCAMADDTRIDMRNDYFRVQSKDRPSVLLFPSHGKRRNSRSGSESPHESPPPGGRRATPPAQHAAGGRRDSPLSLSTTAAPDATTVRPTHRSSDIIGTIPPASRTRGISRTSSYMEGVR